MGRTHEEPGTKRDYLAEAYAIINGETMLLPERAHLIALEQALENKIEVMDEVMDWDDPLVE